MAGALAGIPERYFSGAFSIRPFAGERPARLEPCQIFYLGGQNYSTVVLAVWRELVSNSKSNFCFAGMIFDTPRQSGPTRNANIE